MMDRTQSEIKASSGKRKRGRPFKKGSNLPFVKNTSLWTTIESMDVFKQMPQRPHFKPLEQKTESSLEGSAIGYMVSFSNVVNKAFGLQFRDPITIVDDILITLNEAFGLQFRDPINIVDDSLITLNELENHGFDANLVREHVDGFVEAREKRIKLDDEVNELDSQILVHNHKKCEIEKEISELQNKLSLARSAMRNEGGEIADLKVKLLETKNSYESVRREFLSSGWYI